MAPSHVPLNMKMTLDVAAQSIVAHTSREGPCFGGLCSMQESSGSWDWSEEQ